MDNQTNNPLSDFFRQPVIHYKLPSGGRYWEENSLNLPVTGEIPVLSMTTKDEITIRTPDALLNGSGVVSVIQSCCPNIINAWDMPSIDVDTTLISIRIASYGSEMDIETVCPHCKEEHSYGIDLNQVLNNMVTPDYSVPIRVDGLSIVLRPQPYFKINKTNTINFEEQRLIDTINNQDLPDDEKTAQFSSHLERLVEMSMKIIVDSTESITTPNGIIVTQPEFILEFYQKAGRTVVKTVRDWLEKASTESAIKPVTVECTECHTPFDLAITFDYSNFFA